MRFHFQSYAKSDSGTVPLHDYTRDYDRLDKLRDQVVNVYEQICYRSDVKFTNELAEEAKTHAYALWVACDKMQVVNRVGNTVYVLNVTVLSGEHDKS